MRRAVARYDIGEFAAKLAEAFSHDRPDVVSISIDTGEVKHPAPGVQGAVASRSDQAEGAWEIRWPEGQHIYGYMLRDAAYTGQPNRVEIKLVHPHFHPSLKHEAVITVRHDRPMLDIIRDIENRLLGRVPEIGHKSDRIRWNQGLTDPEIEWNEFRRDELNRIWTALSNLGVEHPLFVSEILIPTAPGGEGRICSYEELEHGLDNFEVAFCLGYLYSMLNEAEDSGIFEEDFGVETWREALLGEIPEPDEPDDPK